MGVVRSIPVKMIEVSRITLFLGLFGILRAQMCRPAENTLGDCGCDGQIFVSSDCRQAYHCRDDLTSTDGCLAQCGEGDIVIPDPRNGDDWYCVPQEQENGEHLQCPGSEEDCPLADCECEGQLSVNNDCTKGKLCKSDGEEDAEDVSCPVFGEIIMVNLVTYDITCGPDDGRCPGAFSVGCDTGTTTTTTTTTTTEGQTTTTTEGQTTTTEEGQTTTTAEGETTTTPSSSSTSNWVVSMITCVSIFLVQLL